jgi:DNA invertase Pin-like site-specific DNA recombinase
MEITRDQLAQIIPKNPYIDHWCSALNEILPEYEIDTPQRVAAFLAQCAHESGGFVFLKENLTFSGNDDPMSNLLLGILSSLSEWERAVIKSRQMEGVKIAKEKGIYKERCGRKPKLTEEQMIEVKQRLAAGETKAEISRAFGVSRQTVYNLVAG